MVVAVAMLGACGGDDGSGAEQGPRIVVTTTILGDIVRNVAGDAAEVEVLMPIGADPHDFAPSARQAEAMANADLLVVNGGGFEEGLSGVVEAAEADGAAVFTVVDPRHVALLEADGTVDPHVWTDPHRMAGVVEALGERLGAVEGMDASNVADRAAAYAGELRDLDAEVRDQLADIPAAERVLVTNHDALTYFADRYDFEVVGTVIPGLTTNAAPSAADLAELAEVIRERNVPAIFAETTSSTELAEALAAEVGDRVDVVELFTESLGEEGSGADTYVDLVRTDAGRIEGALVQV